MKSIKQRIIDKEISFYVACEKYYNELTEEDFDYIVERLPSFAAEFLNQHPLLTQEHVDFIIKKDPWYAARFLNQHPFLTQEHVDYIIREAFGFALKYLSHKFSEENIAYLAENKPEILKEMFK